MKFGKVNEKEYRVPSEFSEGEVYTISRAFHGKHWVCNCPAFLYRKEDRDCKHIAALKEKLNADKT